MNFRETLKKIKRYLSKNPIVTALALSVSFYYLGKALQTKISTVKLSYFMLALSQNLIAEIIINGNKLIFRGVKSNTYYQTNCSLLT